MTHKQEVPVDAGDIASWTLMCVFPGQTEIMEPQPPVGGVTKSKEEVTQEVFVVIGSLLHHIYCRRVLIQHLQQEAMTSSCL